MDSAKVNSWLALLANLGVVVGLALLIYEVRESQKLAETEATVGRLNQMQVARLEFAMNEFLIPIKVKALTGGVHSLSPVELLRLQEWEKSVRLRMLSQYVQYTQGYIDQSIADGVVNAAAEDLPYWEELGFELGNDEFNQAIKNVAGR